MRIRSETLADVEAIRRLNVDAFSASELGYSGEAELIDRIRVSHAGDFISLVAESGSQIVGHILFTPAVISNAEEEVRGMALGPMAVAPDCQRQGIGTRLVTEGLNQLRANDTRFVVVLGHPGYYPRFGFRPSAAQGVDCEFTGVPEEAFMLLVLDERAGPRLQGVARYLPAFGDAV